MSFIGKNIKKIRTIKKLSQADFAKLFDLARPSVGAYEEGRAEPKIDTIIEIAKKYRLSIDLLLTKELTINELYKFDIFKKDYDKSAPPHPPQENVPGGFIPLVGSDIGLEYVVNLKNRDFIENLPRINFPVKVKEQLRAFEVSGSEMEYYQQGIHHGDILVGAQVNLAKNSKLNPGSVYLIVTPKEIKARRLADAKIPYTFNADDPNYPVETLSPPTILELWEVKAVFSSYLNPPQRVEERLMVIEDQVTKLAKELGKFRK